MRKTRNHTRTDWLIEKTDKRCWKYNKNINKKMALLENKRIEQELTTTGNYLTKREMVK